MADEIEEAAAGLVGGVRRTRLPGDGVAIQQKRRVPEGDRVEQGKDAGFVPGCACVYIRTWGCSHNTSDGEYMAGVLSAAGYEIVKDKMTADLWILNSCTVKTPSEDTFNNAIREGQKLGKKLVLAGCVAQAQPRGKMTQGLSIVGIHQIDRVLEVVEETLQGRTVRLLSKKSSGAGGAPLAMPKIRRNELIEIIPINTGCLNQCTYCKTKHARGQLNSYPADEIVARVRQVVAEGVVEIWLTSEDTGTYGRDRDDTIVNLLWKIIEVLPDGVMLRVGMTNPPYILEHLEEMAKILNHPRVYAFLHIPIQAASDAVLTTMKREYNCEEFCHIVDFLRERVPNVTIATDIICGFPGETEEDFQETMDLCEKYKFPSLFINQAHLLPAWRELIPATVKKRTKRLSELFQSYLPYEHKLGQRQRVLVTDVSTDGNYFVAHNKSFDQVLVPRRPEIMGKMITVDITATGKHFLMGRVVEESVSAAQLPSSTSSSRLPTSTSASPSASALLRAVKHVALALLLLVTFDILRKHLFS
ncbi:cdk5 regulatory subunit associated protein 1 [Salpingoeca rosetta]|uniref:Threonylcarbamoyladenosine tRNA methylthiotransferase n=1 Tax=Salpingoeca rosetta (strain ATCC 50818 / BSB-021) TaxID=946362 RepID=F2UF97_SALR5|nr:cdk5 regulatory subunit associated protein 1 [Salpingoeca rosetta]EGD75297.1 cdk5 regulatory subunit associated protein 1 [Salpingoeca rosetta]|eukprot:XP_004992350.1 cdk5 regulatory subunit associated protein 1 [Salpingoeca rosetta]